MFQTLVKLLQLVKQKQKNMSKQEISDLVLSNLCTPMNERVSLSEFQEKKAIAPALSRLAALANQVRYEVDCVLDTNRRQYDLLASYQPNH